MNDKSTVFFITGNSRSGTTMMMRILDNHPEVHAINEPHFFEKLWTPKDQHVKIDRKEAFDLYAKLFTGQRAGFFEKVDDHVHEYRSEIETILGQYDAAKTRLEVYSDFMHIEASAAGKSIPCEKTPQNVFYIKEILENFPNARIINLIRDPRGVMLSQKRKWKRRELGAHFITKREVLRLRINYHPFTISRLWNASIGAVQPYENESRVRSIRFEDLTASPEHTMAELCKFLQIQFDPNMLMVPHAGSSTEADLHSQLGIRKKKPSSWLEKGLTASEIKLCQNVCAANMAKYGYEPVKIENANASILALYISFPFKLVLALAVNLGRMRSLVDTLKRRLASK